MIWGEGPRERKGFNDIYRKIWSIWEVRKRGVGCGGCE